MEYFTELFTVLLLLQIVGLLILFSAVQKNTTALLIALLAVIGLDLVVIFLFRKYATGEPQTISNLFGTGFAIMFALVLSSLLVLIFGILKAVSISNKTEISKLWTVPLPVYVIGAVYMSLFIIAKIEGDK